MNPDVEVYRVLAEAGVSILVGTGAATAGLILASMPLLRRYALARPGARSSHVVPTPQGGGAAVVAAALLVPILIATLSSDGGALARLLAAPPVVATAIAAVGLAVLGLVDDIRPLPPLPRLVFQVAAVTLVVVAVPADWRIVEAVPAILERLAVALGLLWFVNLVNFMDGLDWMTVVELVPLTAALVVLTGLDAVPPAGGLVALALLGALLGFAPFNRPRARLFLGDVGSLPLGLVTGWLLLGLAGRGHLAAALLLPLYYLADATLTLMRRVVRRERFWEAHRTHFYQRATAGGLSVPEVIGRVAAVNLVLAGLAIGTVAVADVRLDIAALLLGAALVTALLADLFRTRRRAPAGGTPFGDTPPDGTSAGDAP
ncbi:glycosyl transferase [Rhodoplanes serenus]|uniref:Glycosyl transferase n=1 Tax=Rhodoplanes serenus TaxID=200615 RepID=A0A9X4XJV9_9BRAD|nr:glycosyl transferase [Rhodoplanes serenus]